MEKYIRENMLRYLSKVTDSRRAYNDYERFLEGLPLKSEQLLYFKNRPVEFIDTVYSVFKDHSSQRDFMLLRDLLVYCPYLLDYKTKSVHAGIKKVCQGIKNGDIDYIRFFNDKRLSDTIIDFLFSVLGFNDETIEMCADGYVSYDFGAAVRVLADPRHGLLPTGNGVIQFSEGEYLDWFNGARYGTKEIL